MEYCDKNLEHVLKDLEQKNSKLEIGEVKRLVKETLDGLQHMHDLNIVHRDLKPENILLKDESVRICDLGSSKVIDNEGYMNTPYVVSRYYRSPELILGSSRYGPPIDIWGKNFFTYFFLQPLGAFYLN